MICQKEISLIEKVDKCGVIHKFFITDQLGLSLIELILFKSWLNRQRRWNGMKRPQKFLMMSLSVVMLLIVKPLGAAEFTLTLRHFFSPKESAQTKMLEPRANSVENSIRER